MREKKIQFNPSLYNKHYEEILLMLSIMHPIWPSASLKIIYIVSHIPKTPTCDMPKEVLHPFHPRSPNMFHLIIKLNNVLWKNHHNSYPTKNCIPYLKRETTMYEQIIFILNVIIAEKAIENWNDKLFSPNPLGKKKSMLRN